MADPPEREVGKGTLEAGRSRLEELGKRMELEKVEVIRYLENKKDKKEILIPDGWMEWWRMINIDIEKQNKKKRLQQAEQEKNTFRNKVLPNQVLVGWRGWWSRMEAESRKEEKERKRADTLKKAQERMLPIETYFKNLKTKIESEGKEKFSSLRQISSLSSPKRKLLSTTSSTEPSPGKKRKLNFRENLKFW